MILIPPFLAEILPEILRVSAIVTVIALVFLFLCPNLIVSEIMYIMHLKRTKKEKWARACSTDDPTHVKMYNDGKEWISQFADKKVDVHIVNEGLNLYGEFYDDSILYQSGVRLDEKTHLFPARFRWHPSLRPACDLALGERG